MQRGAAGRVRLGGYAPASGEVHCVAWANRAVAEPVGRTVVVGEQKPGVLVQDPVLYGGFWVEADGRSVLGQQPPFATEQLVVSVYLHVPVERQADAWLCHTQVVAEAPLSGEPALHGVRYVPGVHQPGHTVFEAVVAVEQVPAARRGGP